MAAIIIKYESRSLLEWRNSLSCLVGSLHTCHNESKLYMKCDFFFLITATVDQTIAIICRNAKLTKKSTWFPGTA